MASIRPPRSAGLCFLSAVLLALGAIALLPGTPAPAITGTTGPIAVTVAPTDNLSSGQVIAVDATATDGTMTQAQAHVCSPDLPLPVNQFKFTSDIYCPNVTLTGGDVLNVKTVTTGPQATEHLDVLVGTGHATWIDGFGGDTHDLDCDSTHSCNLVIQFQSSVTPGTFYFIAPLTYSDSGVTTTSTSTSSTTTTPTTLPSTTTTTTTQPSTTTTTSSSTTTTQPSTTTTTTTTTTRPSTTTTSSATTTTRPSTTTTTTQPSTTTTTSSSSTTTTQPSTTTTTMSPSGGDTATPSQVAPGGTFTVTSTGWQPNSNVDATLHSDPVTLGSLTADPTGQVQGSFDVPSGTASGAHTVDLVGTGQSGDPRTVSIPLTVTGTGSASTTGGSGTTTTGAGSTTSNSLPFTGANSRDLTSGAVLMLALGLFLTARSLRRRPQHAL